MMAESTTIAWTDHTFNPWWGCTKVSPGCTNCYAERFDKRVGGDHWGPGKARRVFGDSHWKEPLKWSGRVFCASMADIFDEEAPANERERLWELIRSTPDLTWQLLTKRPVGYHDLTPLDILMLPRVWKGFTAEDQQRYDERWSEMRWVPGIRFCSYEPALGALTLDHFVDQPEMLVFGGESGPRARACSELWARSLLGECRQRKVAFFMKQMSARTPAQGKKLIPRDLLIHELPLER